MSDTAQQRAALRANPVARQIRAAWPEGLRVEGAPGHLGTVERHVPGMNAQGGHLVVRWDSGPVGHHSPVELHRVTDRKLTTAQERYLAEIRAVGERAYNGRARRPVEALAAAGLIEYDFALVPHADSGGGIAFTERFTCRPVGSFERSVSGSTPGR